MIWRRISTDEKKIRSADARAIAKKQKTAARKPYNRPATSSRSRASVEEDDHRGVFHGPTYNVPPNSRYRCITNDRTSTQQSRYSATNRRYDDERTETQRYRQQQIRCWGCGKHGHYRNECRDSNTRLYREQRPSRCSPGIATRKQSTAAASESATDLFNVFQGKEYDKIVYVSLQKVGNTINMSLYILLAPIHSQIKGVIIVWATRIRK